MRLSQHSCTYQQVKQKEHIASFHLYSGFPLLMEIGATDLPMLLLKYHSQTNRLNIQGNHADTWYTGINSIPVINGTSNNVR